MPLQRFLNSQFKVGIGLKLWVFSTSFYHSVLLINLHWIGFQCFYQGVEMQHKRNSLWLFLSYVSTTLNRLSLRAKCEIDWKPIVTCLKEKHQKKSNRLSDQTFPIWVSCSLSKRGSSVFGLVALLIFLQLQVAHWAERKLIYLCQSRPSVTSATAFWTAEKVSAVTDVFVCGAADHTVVLLKSLSIVITTVIWFHVAHRRSSYQHPIRRLRVI